MDRLATTTFMVAFLTATGASAAPPSDVRVQLPLDADITPASLTAAPLNNDLEREYPRVPLMMGLGGSAMIKCKVRVIGTLDDCHVTSEEPAGMGFGAATIRAAAYFRLRPAMQDGRPVETTITIPMRWRTPGRPAAPDAPLQPVTPGAMHLGRRIMELENTASHMQAAWRPALEQQTAQLAVTDDAQAGANVIDAFRQGLADAIQAEVDRQAHELAARESEADLKATVAFLESPAGKAWVQTEAQSQADAPKDFYARIAQAARPHLCQGECAGAAQNARTP